MQITDKDLRRCGASVPIYAFPEDAVLARAAAERLSSMHEIADREEADFKDHDAAKARQIIADALAGREERYLTQSECRPLLECYRLPLLFSRMASSADEAAGIVQQSGRTVVMKIMSPDVVHKLDSGGVILGVNGAAAATFEHASKLKAASRRTP